MEDVLDVYEQPYDPKRPVICFDERPCQLIGDVISPIPMKLGSPKKEHYEYSRNGTCCIFMAFEPRAGRRVACVKEHRTKVDYADLWKCLPSIIPMQSVFYWSRTTSTLIPRVHFMKPYLWGSFRAGKRSEYHYTPKKGSWLNIAEIELSALSKQCLDRRIEI